MEAEQGHVPRKRLGKRLAWLLRVLALVIGVALLAFAGSRLMHKQQAVTGAPVLPAPEAVATTDSSVPDEKKPDVAAPYEVPAGQPRRIIMPDLQVDGFVQKVGLTSGNQVATPSNVHMGGWFVDSVLPGQAGLSIIDGHVSGVYSDGLFISLKRSKVGSKFQIEFGDRSIKNFEVTNVQSVPVADAGAALFAKDPNIEAQLNLITCGGTFNRDAQQYADRVIVAAKLIP